MLLSFPVETFKTFLKKKIALELVSYLTHSLWPSLSVGEVKSFQEILNWKPHFCTVKGFFNWVFLIRNVVWTNWKIAMSQNISEYFTDQNTFRLLATMMTMMNCFCGMVDRWKAFIALFPAGTIIRDPQLRESLKRLEQDLNLRRTWV